MKKLKMNIIWQPLTEVLIVVQLQYNQSKINNDSDFWFQVSAEMCFNT